MALKKRSLGVTLFALFEISGTAILLFSVSSAFLMRGCYEAGKFWLLMPPVVIIRSVLFAILGLCLGVGLLRLRKWARTGMMLFAVYGLGYNLFDLSKNIIIGSFPLLPVMYILHLFFIFSFNSLILYYFTRPGVKEQFE